MSDAEAPPTPRQVAEAVLFDARQRSKLVSYASARFGIGVADAEDLLQDTALELLRQRGYVRSPDGFVFAAFRARCGRFAETRRRRGETFSQGLDGFDALPNAAGAESVDRRLSLQEALNVISSACRRLLSAHYIEGQSLNETAETLTSTYSVVSRRINRCLQRLRACLN
jgi:RNA polymerase sigma factor (sigma-70 family)